MIQNPQGMKKYLVNIIGLFSFLISINLDVNAQITSDFTAHNENIVWESVFTDGSPGKVNRGIVDSDGNAIVLFMPENQSRIHKIKWCIWRPYMVNKYK